MEAVRRVIPELEQKHNALKCQWEGTREVGQLRRFVLLWKGPRAEVPNATKSENTGQVRNANHSICQVFLFTGGTVQNTEAKMPILLQLYLLIMKIHSNNVISLSEYILLIYTNPT